MAVSSTVAVYFGHPLAQLPTSAHDMIKDVAALIDTFQKDKLDKSKVAKNGIHLINNALYLAFVINGGLELSIALLAVAMIQSGYEAYMVKDKQKDYNYIEVIAHLAMAMIRSYQLYTQLQLLDFTKPLPANFSKELIAIFNTYGEAAKSRNVPISVVIAEAGDIHAMKILLLARFDCGTEILPRALEATQYEMARLLLDQNATIAPERVSHFILNVNGLENEANVQDKLAMIKLLMEKELIALNSSYLPILKSMLETPTTTDFQKQYQLQVVTMLNNSGAELVGTV